MSAAAEQPAGLATVDTTAYWNIRDIQLHCRVSRSTAWRMVRDEGFPPPVVYGRSILWPSAEVQEFLELHRRPDHYATARHRGQAVSTDAPFVSRPVGRRTRG